MVLGFQGVVEKREIHFPKYRRIQGAFHSVPNNFGRGQVPTAVNAGIPKVSLFSLWIQGSAARNARKGYNLGG